MTRENNPIRVARVLSGLTQATVAETTGISQQMLSKLESGERTLKYDVAVRLAELFNCDVSDLDTVLASTHTPRPETDVELKVLRLFRKIPEAQQEAAITILRSLSA